MKASTKIFALGLMTLTQFAFADDQWPSEVSLVKDGQYQDRKDSAKWANAEGFGNIFDDLPNLAKASLNRLASQPNAKEIPHMRYAPLIEVQIQAQPGKGSFERPYYRTVFDKSTGKPSLDQVDDPEGGGEGRLVLRQDVKSFHALESANVKLREAIHAVNEQLNLISKNEIHKTSTGQRYQLTRTFVSNPERLEAQMKAVEEDLSKASYQAVNKIIFSNFREKLSALNALTDEMVKNSLANPVGTAKAAGDETTQTAQQ